MCPGGLKLVSATTGTGATRRLEIVRRSGRPPDLADVSQGEWPLRGDTVEELGSCQPLAGLIQSGPGDRSGSDDGGTPRPAGCAVLRVLARTACAGEAPAAID